MTDTHFHRRWRWPVVLLGPGVVLAAGAYYLAVDLAASAGAPEHQWLAVEPRPLSHEVGLVGRIEPRKVVTLTAPFDGNILAIHAEGGQRVTAGQLLLEMDPQQVDMQLRDALAAQLKARRTVAELQDWTAGLAVARSRRAVASARSVVSGLERKLDESRALLARGIIARNEVDELQQQLDGARIDLAASLGEAADTLEQGSGVFRQIAELELANATLRYEDLKRLRERAEITAPFPGAVVPMPEKEGSTKAGTSTGMVQVGSRVSHGQPLFTLSGGEQLNIVSLVSEMDINKLQAGQLVEVTGDGFEGDRLLGGLELVSDLAVPESEVAAGAQFVVVASIHSMSAQQRARLKVGMSVRLTVVTYRNEQAMVVPAKAISQVGETRTVLHRESMGVPPREVPVTLGQATVEGVEVFGLEPGFVATPGPEV